MLWSRDTWMQNVLRGAISVKFTSEYIMYQGCSAIRPADIARPTIILSLK